MGTDELCGTTGSEVMFTAMIESLVKTTYMVCVSWEEKDFTHVAHSYDDAIEWMACYPAAASVSVYSKGKLITAR